MQRYNFFAKFLLHFARLIVPLILCIQGRLHLENENKNIFFLLHFARFALPLKLHIQGTHTRKYKRKTDFSFVFRSLNRTFANATLKTN